MYIASKYFVDGEECSEDEYEELVDMLDSENEKFEDEEDFCDCYECTIDRYVELLQEITGGCPGCIREALESFCDEIVDHIVIEDMEDDD